MMGNYQVRFLGGKGAVMPPTYPIYVTVVNCLMIVPTKS